MAKDMNAGIHTWCSQSISAGQKYDLPLNSDWKDATLPVGHDFYVWAGDDDINSVATSPVVLRWLCDSPRTGCARRTKIYVCGANKQ